MKSIDQWLAEYGESHQNKINKIIHWICVPTIMFTVIGFFVSIPRGEFFRWAPPEVAFLANWAGVFVILAGIFYLLLSIPLFVGMMLIALAMLVAAHALSQVTKLWLLCLVLFVVAWIFQFIGHKIEGKKPSFFQDILFLLVGPAWLLSFIYRRLGIRYS
ncbi:MAG: DUF962 domain-containing protein [Turneriella sp.]|nr:DUF962 domain-containing protein [Turneriella sp.]